MEIKDLPIHQKVIVANTEHIFVQAVRINKEEAYFTWEIPNTNREVLRTKVNISGYTILESYDESFWNIIINDEKSDASGLEALVGKSIQINAEPASKILSIITN